MKTKLFLTLLLFAGSVFADQSFGTFGNWSVSQVSNHDLWQTGACMAAISADANSSAGEDGSTSLQFYSAQATNQSLGFTEPTIQILSYSGTAFVQGTLSDGTNTLNFMMANNSSVTNVQGLMSRIADRKMARDMIRNATNLTVQLMDASKNVVKTITFSNAGAGQAIDLMNSSCKVPTLDKTIKTTASK